MRRKFTRIRRKVKGTRRIQRSCIVQGSCIVQKGGGSPLFDKTYVISTDKNSQRYKNVENKAKVAGLSIHLWQATIIKPDKKIYKELPLKGIGLTNFIDRTSTHYNLGTVGCFLSHRDLLEYLSESKSTGTLILEDDCEIPPDLFQKLQNIELPNDWDILFLDKWGKTKSETPVNKGLVKIKKTLDPECNWGTYSYIVKNSSIKTKILPALKHMINHLDQQYTTYADVINEYIAYGIIPVNRELHNKSTITAHEFNTSSESKKKILIVMSDNRRLGNEYNSLTACINYEYSKKHGYDFIYYRPYFKNSNSYELNNCLDSRGNKRHASWSKILSCKKALEMNYDYVVYIDTDCIFKDLSRTIEEYIKPLGNKDIMFLDDKPWGTTYPCAGFYICKVTKESKRLMNDWYAVDLPENNNKHPWEQAALVKIFKNYNIQLIDDWMFREKEGQYLRHIGSEEGQNRVPYFKNFIKNMGIDINNIIPKIHVINYDTLKMT